MIRVEVSDYKFFDGSVAQERLAKLRTLFNGEDRALYSSFSLQGHADQAAYGYDVVCAAATNLAATAIASLLDIAKLENLRYELAEGSIYCTVGELTELSETQFLLSQVILQVFVLGIEQIVQSEQAQLGKYIELVHTKISTEKR